MWFRRKKKPDQDSVLNEALRSLQGILEESDTDEMQAPDGRREPALRSQAQAEDAAAADDTTPLADAPEDGAEPSPETTWHNLSLSFDVEPRARPEPEPEDAAEQQSSSEAAEDAAAADEEGALEIQETREAADTTIEAHDEDDDLQIVIDSPAPGYARDRDEEDDSSAVKFGSSVVEITLDLDDFHDDAKESGEPAASGTPIQAAEAGTPVLSDGPPIPGEEAGTTDAEPGEAPPQAAEPSARPPVIDGNGDGETVDDHGPPLDEEPEPEASTAAAGSAPTGTPREVEGDDAEPAEAGEPTTESIPAADDEVAGPLPAEETTATARTRVAADAGQAEAVSEDELTSVEEAAPQTTADDLADAGTGHPPEDATDQAAEPEALTPAPEPSADQAAVESREAPASAGQAAGAEAAEATSQETQQPGTDTAAVDRAAASIPSGEQSSDAASIGSESGEDADALVEDAAASGTDDAAPQDALPPPQEAPDQAGDAIAAVAEAIRDAEALRMQAGDVLASAATSTETDDSSVPAGDTHAPEPPSPAQQIPPAAELDDDIPLLDDLVYVPDEKVGTVDQFLAGSPPPQATAEAEVEAEAATPTAATAAGPQSDPELRRLVQRITQNLRLRLELGEGTPLDEEQESQLRDALFDTLSQWKEQGDL